MRDFFKVYKEYLVKQKCKSEFKPTSDKFNNVVLYNAYKNVKSPYKITDADKSAIHNFTRISQQLHDLYKNLYQRLEDDLNNLNLRGIEAAEYIVAALNREYKVTKVSHPNK